jgi:hypothetical protein
LFFFLVQRPSEFSRLYACISCLWILRAHQLSLDFVSSASDKCAIASSEMSWRLVFTVSGKEDMTQGFLSSQPCRGLIG